MQLIPQDKNNILKSVSNAAHKAGVKAWLVGGFVRDAYLNKNNTDIDIVFEGDIDKLFALLIKELGGGTYKTHAKFLTATFFLNGISLDFAHARSEIYKYNGALPTVEKSDIKNDLRRRDFSVNAVALSLNKDALFEIYDPFNGLKDIDANTLSVLHNKSFYDDPTRLYRLVRFMGRFNWHMGGQTKELFLIAVKEKLPNLVSIERLNRELFCLLAEENPKPAFIKTKEYGLMDFIEPSFEWNENILKTSDVNGRFILMVYNNPKALEIAKKLGISNELKRTLAAVIKFVNSQTITAIPLNEFEKNLIKIILPGLPPEALLPRFISGNDVKKAGINEGEKLSFYLEECSKAQREGLIKNKESGLIYLKNLLKPQK